ncbi:MAG: hypothetical protein HYX69_02910 [Planctomycetia bacterium]|nr:hypothetical protein [Planctomycetia bacterium]
MSDGQIEKRYPSVEEFKGWYNLGYSRDDGLPVLHSTDRVPDFEHAEFFELYMAENRWFEQLAPASAHKHFDPLADPPIFVRSNADDRTLKVYPDINCLTVDLVRRIQHEFLGRYPLWRVILIAEHPSCSIVIYPRAIRFGNLPLDADPEEALGELVPRAIALREKRLRPQRAQVAFLQRQLPDAVRTMGDRPFLVVGVLDNDRGDPSRLTIFVLVRGPDYHAVDVELPPGMDNDFLWTSSGYAVNAQGILLNDEQRGSASFSVGALHAACRLSRAALDRRTGVWQSLHLRAEVREHHPHCPGRIAASTPVSSGGAALLRPRSSPRGNSHADLARYSRGQRSRTTGSPRELAR